MKGATNALMEFADVFPTLMDFANIHLPNNYIIDGISMKPFCSVSPMNTEIQL